MKSIFRSASRAALLFGVAGAMPAWAQQASDQPPVDQIPAAVEADSPARDRVVVTGSLIKSSPEDAALPVEVFTMEDLEEQGAPTALEFAKNLTISGPTQGEANFQGGSAPGAVQFNLRGIGADKTLTLLNGRRVSDVTSFIPNAALARTELLKDGAAVTYGADAIGGVVNFITRDDFVGLDVRASYKFIDGSDGDYGGSILGGIGDGNTNFMWSVEYDHRSELSPDKRDWAVLPFTTNPAPWSSLSNIGNYTPRGVLPTGPITYGANGQYSLASEWGAALGTAIPDNAAAIGTRAQNCAAVGGYFTTSCQFGYFPFYALVEDQDIYRGYAQLNTDINEDMHFHIDVAYGQVKSATHVSPSLPTSRGPARTISEAELFIPRANPFVSQFLLDTGYAAPASLSGFTIANAGSFYRTFAFQGTSAFGDDTSLNEYDSQVYRVSASIDGRLGSWAGMFSDVNYDAAVTWNSSNTRLTGPDLLGFRIQEALSGFGGPNCNAADLDPNRFGTQNPAAAGKNGCLWLNPFVTSFQRNPALNLLNPQSGTNRNLAVPTGATSWENSTELQQWLFDKRETEDINTSLTLDLVFSGMTGLELPGGEVGWALGFQGRMLENRDNVPSVFHNGSTPCMWPGQDPAAPGTAGYTGCTQDNPGPFVFFSPDPPVYQDQQQKAVFAEIALPVLDNLNLSAAVRREEFSGGLSDTVYKVSGKWDVWGPISIRGSYGTNYQAPPIGIRPGEVNNGVTNYALAGNAWLPSTQITRTDVVPATATSWNAGIIWQSEGFAPDHGFRFIVDYFDIETENEFRTLATTNQILEAVWSLTDTYDQCTHPLASRIRYVATTSNPNATCAGATRANLQNELGGVTTEYGNGPGVVTNGFDYQIDYTMPFGEGDFTIGATATQVTELRDTAVTLDGFQLLAGAERLGELNFAAAAVAAPEWSVNAFASYRLGQHVFRAGANWRSAVVDERAGIQYGEYGEDPVYIDLNYLFDVTDTLRLSASIQNLFDRDPPKHQIEYGYDARLGSALGRTFELSVKQVF